MPRATLDGGIATYRDLFIRRRGRGYQLRFEAMPAGCTETILTSTEVGELSGHILLLKLLSYLSPQKALPLFYPPTTLFRHTLTCISTLQIKVDIGFAAEFEVMSSDREEQDKFGQGLALDGDLLVVGAPGKHLDRPEIQIIKTTGKASSVIKEIQAVATAATHVNEIQQFSTHANPGEQVGGYWTISYPDLGTTRSIPAKANADQVRTFLMEDLPELGRVQVTRTIYDYCACTDGFLWTFEFDERQGDILELQPASQLTGVGAAVGAVEVLQDSPVLSGTFTLGYNGRAQYNDINQSAVTRDLSYDISASDLLDALEDDLGIDIDTIDEEPPDNQLGRKWLITFNADWGDYDVPELTSDASGLQGNGAKVWHKTGRNGQGPLTGHFKLRFNGSQWTDLLAADITDTDLQAELLTLESIDDVTVSRSEPGDAGDYSWFVTFLKVRSPSAYGFVSEPMGNLPAIETDGFQLTGRTGASVSVSYISGGEMDYAPWEGKALGSYGAETGAAYVLNQHFEAGGSIWLETQILKGNDSDELDRFGHSVSADNTHDLIIVGAPYAEDTGVLEQQSLTCTATSGTFTLRFRGFTTDPIPHDVQLTELYKAIRGPFGTTRNLHTLPELDIDYEGGVAWANFCDNGGGGNTAVITFRTPQHAYSGGRGDLELLEADTTLLVGGALTLAEVTKGTVQPDGRNSRGIQKGAAYVYRKGAGVWAQEQKLFLDDGLGTDRFGWQVLVQGRAPGDDYAIVSAPGREGEKGVLFVFTHDSVAGWSLLQELRSDQFSLEQDELGTAIDMSENTLVAGGKSNYDGDGNAIRHVGSVYVYVLSIQGVFQLDQHITQPSPAADDRFGEALSLHEDMLVVGCPGCDDNWQYTRPVRSSTVGSDTGAVYVYKRENASSQFSLFQKLVPSNIKPGDRFGVSVSTTGATIIASSHYRYQPTAIHFQRAVQSITVEADAGGVALSNWYQLGWGEECLDDGDDDCEVRWTRDIPVDATAALVKRTLEEDFNLLGASELVVTRSGQNADTLGFQYMVTFLEQDGQVPLMKVDYSGIRGNNARVVVEFENKASSLSQRMTCDVPRALRGVTHLFQMRDSSDPAAEFKEQCFLYPWLRQRQDLFGTVAAGKQQLQLGSFLAVGAPNRDTLRGSQEDLDLTSINSGAVFVFDLELLSYRFASLSYSVLEGATTALQISRDASHASTEQAFLIKSLDRNAEPEVL
ncbi:unnamed protein product [Chrysoparadoxa australica]